MLNLLGAYLRDINGHHIDYIKKIPEIDVSEDKGRYARKIMNAFALRWGDNSETNLLHILGSFDRPADYAAIDAIIGQDIISGLTDHLHDQSIADWLLMLEKLRKARLIAPKSEHHQNTLDCHPLVREHFGEKLQQTNPQAWQQAHERLYIYYKSLPKKDLPDTLEDMAPLFSAVAHGCMAGKHQEILYDVYWERICRNNDGFIFSKLGAFNSNLSALANFFDMHWHKASRKLTANAKTDVLSWAGFSLRALGRLQEALGPMKTGLKESIEQGTWEVAAQNAENLSELFLILGKIDIAVDYARQSMNFPDMWDHHREIKMTTLANAIFHLGNFAKADRLFREAEIMQKKRQHNYPFLYSQRGYQYCDFLLSQWKYEEVIERTNKILVWAIDNKYLLDIALTNLSMGRAYLLKEFEQKSNNLKSSETYLQTAVEVLRESGVQEFIARGLLSRATLYRAQKNYTLAWEDLDETLDISEQGHMKLFLADYHIEACRLLRSEMCCRSEDSVNLEERFQEHLGNAKEIIKETGYGLRNSIFDGEALLLERL